ncbi:hypothetical protein ABIA32_002731 [Streptacidiphilus sp. MAP12-20]|uniref:hypothetical protein n=1 Tax=Streptacidiphilus sp. MAP12-20 TaxID=3156299 RepID=UPI0035132DAA
MAIALFALYLIGVVGFTRHTSDQLKDLSTTIGRAAKSSPALAGLVAAIVVGLWPVVLPLGALLTKRRP